jgi:hypothetical protein
MAVIKLTITQGDREAASCQRFIDEFVRGTMPTPCGPGRIFGLTGIALGARVDIRKGFEGRIRVTEIWALEKRKGFGTNALRWLCDMADTHGVTLELTPKRIGKVGMTDAQLRRWYKAYGFALQQRGTMQRSPEAQP